jgi:CheY-like chemotaxis protein
VAARLAAERVATRAIVLAEFAEGRPDSPGAAAVLTKPIVASELWAALGVAQERGTDDANGDSPAGEEPILSRPLRVLLVEDNAVNQLLACRLIERRGHHVTVVGDGRQALAALEDACFDVVLMDVQMPVMDGLEATREIRARERGGSRHVPIVAMTAHAMKGDREICQDAGMDGYVSKPIRADELLAAVEGVIAPAAGSGRAG